MVTHLDDFDGHEQWKGEGWYHGHEDHDANDDGGGDAYNEDVLLPELLWLPWAVRRGGWPWWAGWRSWSWDVRRCQGPRRRLKSTWLLSKDKNKRKDKKIIIMRWAQIIGPSSQTEVWGGCLNDGQVDANGDYNDHDDHQNLNHVHAQIPGLLSQKVMALGLILKGSEQKVGRHG